MTTIDSMGNQTIQIKDVHGKTSIEQELNSIGTLLAQHQNFGMVQKWSKLGNTKQSQTRPLLGWFFLKFDYLEL